MTKDERNKIISKFISTGNDYEKLMDRGDYDEARKLRLKRRQLQTRYYDGLPRVTMSVCPFCDALLIRKFDPYGLDGMWWDRYGIPNEPSPCSHFCVLRGAVHYNKNQPVGGHFESRPGPEVPYVLPRLLKMKGMILVISKIRMKNGYTAYPLTYFARRHPPEEKLTAEWKSQIFDYKTKTGDCGFVISNDIWDFELEPWLKKGVIRWCEPRSFNNKLSQASSDQCPYVNLPGRREFIVVHGEHLWTKPLPDGSYISPYDE
jgi:hypothetical protein